MTKAYITNEKGERIENAYPGQTLFVHVKFNRDMATDVQPEVTVGRGTAIWRSMMDEYYTEMPSLHNYDDQIVTGGWISSREWVGYTSFDMSVLEKGNIYENDNNESYPDDKELMSSRYYGIRSEGAVAADDRWLVTGNDGGRFGFNVVKPATIQTGDSETARLTGKGIAGANQLNWEQAETETLAGFNLYRSTDGGVSFMKLNRSLISGEDLQYIDSDVTEGQKYSYYFTTVDTDFHESARSNVVECVPLDGEKPTIVHTPVTYSEPDKAIVITADVTDNVKVESVVLNYKYSDETDWNSVTMRNPSGSTYRTTLSAYEVNEGKLQYYIVASDGISSSYVGTESEPFIITVSQYPETTTSSEVTVVSTATSTTTTTVYTTSTKESTTASTTSETTEDTTSATTSGTSTTTTTATTTESGTTDSTTESTTDTTTETSSESTTTTTTTTTSTVSSTTETSTTESASDTTTTETSTTSTTETASETSSTSSTTAETTTVSESSTSTTASTTETDSTDSTTTASQTTTASTTEEPVSTATTETTPSQPDDYDLGDVNEDGKVDAKDASIVLVAYAKVSTGSEDGLTEKQRKAADVNSDGKVDAKDASSMLTYYALVSTASGDIPTMKEFMAPKKA